MQYHARSLADLEVRGKRCRVSLIGYRGERCFPEVEGHPGIRQHLLPAGFPIPAGVPFVLAAPIKALVLMWRLSAALVLGVARPDVILVQNPPSIPTLLVAWIVSRIFGAKMVIDWHNFGFTVLSLSKGEAHPFVKISRVYESFFARRADSHFSVTQAMSSWMLAEWSVKPTVVYDKAPEFFRQATAQEQHVLFGRLAKALEPAARALGVDVGGGATLFTNPSGELRPDRPALIISSTSWTEDEDFSILLDALVALDDHLSREPDRFPPVLCVVTGKGPLKAYYEKQMAAMVLRRCAVCTMWLEPGDYPLLLGSADLGVCLHTSTSGLDLPMKVVDMFGCGLPVCAVGFNCLSELVRDGENGRVFGSTAELAEQLRALLAGCTSDGGNPELSRLRDGAKQHERWAPNWQRNAAPEFLNAAPGKPSAAAWLCAFTLLASAALAALGLSDALASSVMR